MAFHGDVVAGEIEHISLLEFYLRYFTEYLIKKVKEHKSKTTQN